VADISWVVPVASIGAAVIVASVNAAVQRWRHRVDRLGASVEELCKEINAAADLATAYWLTEAAHQLKNPSAPLRGLEAQLIGRQNRLQELTLALAAQDRRFSINTIEDALPDLFEAMTGGDFQVDGRPISPDQAQLVRAKAAMLNGELRRALGRRLRYWW
jgi:hypothetical protein